MKRVFIRVMILFLLFLSFFIVSAYSYVGSVSTNIADGVFRLHVVANSDSKEDQNLKYKVRDSLLEYMNFLCSNTTSKEEAMEIASAHIEDFKKIAQDVVYSNGYDYSVEVEIAKTNFPIRNDAKLNNPRVDFQEFQKICTNSMNKFYRSFRRLSYHFPEVEVISYPFEMDNGMHLVVPDTISSQDDFIHAVYDSTKKEKQVTKS